MYFFQPDNRVPLYFTCTNLPFWDKYTTSYVHTFLLIKGYRWSQMGFIQRENPSENHVFACRLLFINILVNMLFIWWELIFSLYKGFYEQRTYILIALIELLLMSNWIKHYVVWNVEMAERQAYRALYLLGCPIGIFQCAIGEDYIWSFQWVYTLVTKHPTV